jgi:hypothetical protein
LFVKPNEPDAVTDEEYKEVKDLQKRSRTMTILMCGLLAGYISFFLLFIPYVPRGYGKEMRDLR